MELYPKFGRLYPKLGNLGGTSDYYTDAYDVADAYFQSWLCKHAQ